MNEDAKNLHNFYSYIKENFPSQERFGLRDGYIYSNFVRKIRFEFFLTNKKIGLKYPIANIPETKVTSLDNIILGLDEKFVHKSYNPTPRNKYHIWELPTKGLDYEEIMNMIIKFENIFH
tara:strand:- start:142 stop:501 length:360 start_codon:yes stop_codon:yes gene_type:complete